MVEPKLKHVERRVDRHEESLEHHDRRISQNENWRLQFMGALKFAAFVIGSGALAFLGDIILNIF